ncbi:DNA adenine methylase [Desulfovibrio sp. ZJ369]|uniref:DNA adenine methylase n=1 Tax=Desulfovibrio sp. ZJ369 TaxID=2709793 RepID=UPI0013EC9717|nr:DNA adenine methylase [Desulfovibrio sp. ZJ369]
MEKNALVAPVVKWAGGKRQLLGVLQPLLPRRITCYCEPFVGGGALLFRLQPSRAIINDVNSELIAVYEVIRDAVEDLILTLQGHANEEAYFYAVRHWDRDPQTYDAKSKVEKAARLLFLNKTCYNGLFRVNTAGEFNTPFGRYKNPAIVNAPVLRAVSAYFRAAEISFSSLDYAAVLEVLPDRSFVYLDPPYDPVSTSSRFTGYARGGFSRQEQIRLRECCDWLNRRGIKFMLSNSATAFIRDLYKDYSVTIVRAKRALNSVAARRGLVDEVVVRNYA